MMMVLNGGLSVPGWKRRSTERPRNQASEEVDPLDSFQPERSFANRAGRFLLKAAGAVACASIGAAVSLHPAGWMAGGALVGAILGHQASQPVTGAAYGLAAGFATAVAAFALTAPPVAGAIIAGRLGYQALDHLLR